MKLYTLKKNFHVYKRGTQFYLIAESEFIGVKEFVMRTTDLSGRVSISETELRKNFVFIKDLSTN